MGSENAQPGKLQADSTLMTLLVNTMALPPGAVRMVGDSVVMTHDMHLYAMAVRQRCQELGGDSDAHIQRAYEAIAGRCR